MEKCRIACVRYLNTVPLIEGLSKLDGVELLPTVPAGIAGMVLDGRADVGLVSLADAARGGLVLLPVGMIGCDGPTMTVRVFSRRPLGEVRTIGGDTESHTSVELCRLLMRAKMKVEVEIAPFKAGGEGEWPEAVLLIGDKVVTQAPPADDYPHQLDLGQAWKELTGLPFVYAMWACRAGEVESPAVRSAAAVLDRQRRHNAGRMDWIARKHAAAHGWPDELAREYLGVRLRYEVTARAREAAERFVREAGLGALAWADAREPAAV